MGASVRDISFPYMYVMFRFARGCRGEAAFPYEGDKAADMKPSQSLSV